MAASPEVSQVEESVKTNKPNNDKITKIYRIPDRNECSFVISIKVLQTDRKQRNKLSLSRDTIYVIDTLITNADIVKERSNIFDDHEDNNYFCLTAEWLLAIICTYTLEFYDYSANNINGGISDVSITIFPIYIK